MTDEDKTRIAALRKTLRRMESMIYLRDLALREKHRHTVTTQIVQEAFRRAAQGPDNNVTPERLSVALEAVLNHDADESLKLLKHKMDTVMCSNCDGRGCEACDLTGIPGKPKFVGSGKWVIRSTKGL